MKSAGTPCYVTIDPHLRKGPHIFEIVGPAGSVNVSVVGVVEPGS
jgi:hypothetical protein